MIRDVATGRFVDRDKLHYIDFTGRWFSVKGPSITPRPPQGQPPVTALAHAAIPYRPDQGPYWPVGEIHTDGNPITVSVQADDVDWLQSLLGVDAPAVIGNLTAVNPDGFIKVPTASACKLFVDHLIGARQLSGTKPKSGGSKGRARSKGKAKSSGK